MAAFLNSLERRRCRSFVTLLTTSLSPRLHGEIGPKSGTANLNYLSGYVVNYDEFPRCWILVLRGWCVSSSSVNYLSSRAVLIHVLNILLRPSSRLHLGLYFR